MVGTDWVRIFFHLPMFNQTLEGSLIKTLEYYKLVIKLYKATHLHSLEVVDYSCRLPAGEPLSMLALRSETMLDRG